MEMHTSIFLGLKKAFSGGGPNKVVEFLQNLLNPLENLKEKLEPVTGMLNEFKGCLEAYQQDLKAKTLIKIATAIGILAAALFVISAIDPGDLASALTGMAVLFAELVGAMAALDNKTIRQYEYENFLLEYDAYKALKGNSFIEKIKEEVTTWEVLT